MCVSLRACEDPHGPVHSVDISADQHLHQQGEQLRPGLRPVPVGDGRHGVRNAGADFADCLPQTAWEQLSDGSFSLERDDGNIQTLQNSSEDEKSNSLETSANSRLRCIESLPYL